MFQLLYQLHILQLTFDSPQNMHACLSSVDNVDSVTELKLYDFSGDNLLLSEVTITACVGKFFRWLKRLFTYYVKVFLYYQDR